MSQIRHPNIQNVIATQATSLNVTGWKQQATRWDEQLKEDDIEDLVNLCPHLTTIIASRIDRKFIEYVSKLPQLTTLEIFLSKENNMTGEWAILRCLKNLKSLIIYGAELKRDFFIALRDMPKLESLTLEDCFGILDQNMIDLVHVKHLKSVSFKYINNPSNLSKSPDQFFSEESLRILSQAKALTALEIQNCFEVSDKGFAYLATFNHLKELVIENKSDITNENIQALTRLKDIHKLHLSDCGKVTEEGFVYLNSFRKLVQLTMKYCHSVNRKGLQYIGKLVDLEALTLTYCDCFDCDSDDELCFLSNLPKLKYLNIRCYDLGGLQYLSLLNQLEFLDLSSTFIEDEDLVHLRPLISLKTLNLGSSTLITDKGLLNLANLTSLHSLDLGLCDQITGEGFYGLSKLSNLAFLDLSYCNLNDRGLMALSRLKALTHLDLYACKQISDAGLEGLSSLKHLKILDLTACTGITDEGLKHLSSLMELEDLNLLECPQITDKGLFNILALKSLRELSLSKESITLGGLSYLANLPNLETIYVEDGLEKFTEADLSTLPFRKILQT